MQGESAAVGGYQMHLLMTHRRMQVQSRPIHPNLNLIQVHQWRSSGASTCIPTSRPLSRPALRALPAASILQAIIHAGRNLAHLSVHSETRHLAGSDPLPCIAKHTAQ